MRRARKTMGGRAAYCDKIDRSLADWSALFETLRVEAGGETTHVRIRYQRFADDFAPRQENARRQLARLRAVRCEDWERIKPEVEHAMEELGGLVQRAIIA